MATFAGVGFIALALALGNGAPYWILALIFLVAIGIAIFVYYKDQLRKTAILFYELEPSVEKCYQALHDVFDQLRECGSIWHIEAEGGTQAAKYHAGANRLVKRRPIRPTKEHPSYVKTNVEVPLLSVGRQSLYFFPDRVLIFTADGVGSISYGALSIATTQTRFIEDDAVPRDAKIVDRTWKYVNKSGGPDLRFRDNRELPVVIYEELQFSSASGLNERLQISTLGIGTKLGAAVDELARSQKQSTPPDTYDAVLTKDHREPFSRDADPLYEQAVKIVLATRRASTSLVQRELQIGYNHSAKLLEQMEQAGLISAMKSDGTRDIFVPKMLK